MFSILYILIHLHTKVKHRKRSREDKAGTSDEDDGSGAQQAAAQVLAKSLPAAAPQEPPAGDPPADSDVRVDTPSTKGKKAPQANTLRQLGRSSRRLCLWRRRPPGPSGL